MVYQFRSGGMTGPANRPEEGSNAQVVGERLEYIRDTVGRLTPRIVVDDARPDGSPLHAYFEWSDEIAAEKFRVEQARTLIAAVHIVQESDGSNGLSDTIIARAFISVDEKEHAHYEPLAKVVNDDALYEKVCKKVLAELRRIADNYAQFKSLRQIAIKAHDEIAEELRRHTETTAAPAA